LVLFRTDFRPNVDRVSPAAILPQFPPGEHQPGGDMGNLRHSILSRIVRNNSRGIATSAIWKITCRAWRTTFAPILISSGSVLALMTDWIVFLGAGKNFSGAGNYS